MAAPAAGRLTVVRPGNTWERSTFSATPSLLTARLTRRHDDLPGHQLPHFGSHPRFIDRTYILTTRPNLGPGTWPPLTGSTTSDSGTERTVTDGTAAAPKFYRVEIAKP